MKYALNSQNTNIFPAASPSNATVQCKIIALGKALAALLFNGKPPVLPVAVLVLPTLEARLGADAVEDGPIITCEPEVVVAGTFAVDVPAPPGSVAVFGVLWDAPTFVLSVIDGRPSTVEHALTYARNENV